VSLNIKMVTTSEIILAIIIVSLSVVMPIYYYYQRKKNPKQDNKPSGSNEIKNYIDKINEITHKKHK
jgi:flagellar basal body-associated protein FliL